MENEWNQSLSFRDLIMMYMDWTEQGSCTRYNDICCNHAACPDASGTGLKVLNWTEPNSHVWFVQKPSNSPLNTGLSIQLCRAYMASWSIILQERLGLDLYENGSILSLNACFYR